MKRPVLGALVALVALVPATALAQRAPAPPPLPAPAPPAAAAAPEASPPAPPPAASAPAASAPPAPPAAAAVDLRVPPPSPPPLAPVAAPRPESVTPPGPPRKPLLRLAMGPRIAFIRTAGFDAYSRNDVLAQWSLEGTLTLLEGKKTSLAVGLGYDVGGRSATSRGLTTSVMLHRMSVPIEGRAHLAPWVYLFARVAPGAGIGLARAQDSSAPSDLKGTVGFASGDLSGGASFLFGPHGNPERRSVRIWGTPELGYGVTSRPRVNVAPTGRDAEEVLGQDMPANLGALALSGFFFRLSLAATF
ncbi:MAG: hypothetical protein IPQ09_04685 [Myxococcales bacterium]|nr:hypothetical protein [Myxococcales bacterium]